MRRINYIVSIIILSLSLCAWPASATFTTQPRTVNDMVYDTILSHLNSFAVLPGRLADDIVSTEEIIREAIEDRLVETSSTLSATTNFITYSIQSTGDLIKEQLNQLLIKPTHSTVYNRFQPILTDSTVLGESTDDSFFSSVAHIVEQSMTKIVDVTRQTITILKTNTEPLFITPERYTIQKRIRQLELQNAAIQQREARQTAKNLEELKKQYEQFDNKNSTEAETLKKQIVQLENSYSTINNKLAVQDFYPSLSGTGSLGTSYLKWSALYLTNATIDTAGNLTLEKGANIKGGVTLGDAAADTISFKGRVDTNLLPTSTTSYDLGSSSYYWNTLYAKTITVSETQTLGGNLTINKVDPSLIFNVSSSTDTDFWLGVQDDADNVDDDLFQIGDGTSVGTNPFFTINTSGNVGIGTTGPTAMGTGGTINVLQLHKASGAGTFVLSSDLTTTNTTIGQVVFGSTGITGGEGRTALIVSTKRDAVTTAPLGSLEFYTANGAAPAERVRIDNAGNVGIGTTGPTQLLHIAKSGSSPIALIDRTDTPSNPGIVGEYRIRASLNTASPTVVYSSIVGTSASTNADSRMDLAFYTPDGAAPTEKMRIQWNGNVGIGTTSPTNLLSLGGNSARTFWMERHTTANTAGNNLTIEGGGATSAATDKAGGDLVLKSGLATGTGTSKITFQTHPAGSTGTTDTTATTAMTILGSGNVGIGGASPGTRLHTLDNTTTGPLGITIENNGATTSNLLMFRLISEVGGADNVKFSIDSDGDLLTDGSTTIGTPADVAENYPVSDPTIAAGDVVSLTNQKVTSCNSENKNQCVTLSSLKKALSNGQESVLGVVSSNPGLLLAGYFSQDSRPVALTGRVPVKVSRENGDIAIGDLIAASSTQPGVGIKSNGLETYTIGTALESFDNSSDNSNSVGQILVFLNLVHYRSQTTDNQSFLTQLLSTLSQALSQLTGSVKVTGNWLFDQVEAVFIKAKKIEVEEGISVKDKTTGEYYCVHVNNGQLVNEKGRCGETITVPQPPSPTPTFISTPTITPTPTVTITPTPLIEILVTPTPTINQIPEITIQEARTAVAEASESGQIND